MDGFFIGLLVFILLLVVVFLVIAQGDLMGLAQIFETVSQ